MDKKLPILFIWDKSYGAYIPNTYSQIFFSSIFLKNTIEYIDFPKNILWVGRYWTEYSDSRFKDIYYIRDEELQKSNIIGTLASIEEVMEVTGLENTGAGIERNLLRFSINTSKRVCISDIEVGPGGFYYGKYEPYEDLPITEQEKERVLDIIEQIKEKYVILKDLSPEKLEELVFPVKLSSHTIEEYASIFSLKTITIYKDYNMDYAHKLFVTQNVVLRLQGILLQLDLLIEKYK